MLDKLLGIVAPHHCLSCDKIGTLLCASCKYDINIDKNYYCINCHIPTMNNWLCTGCKKPYQKAWLVGPRQGVLQRLIGLYKFERVRSAYQPLADLLIENMPSLPDNTIIVPVPTVSSHIRERGYDHTFLIAKQISKKLGLKLERPLIRLTNTKQRQASAKTRVLQAKLAFALNPKFTLDKSANYLIIDDVITTGATVHFAANTLKKAGAKSIWVSAVAVQDSKH